MLLKNELEREQIQFSFKIAKCYNISKVNALKIALGYYNTRQVSIMINDVLNCWQHCFSRLSDNRTRNLESLLTMNFTFV